MRRSTICFLLLLISSVSNSNEIDKEFQRYDGWYNNPHHPEYGSVEATLVHHAGVGYSDGVRDMDDDNRPLPGLISDQILRGPDGIPSETRLTALFAFFGQFVAAEIVSTVSSGEIACPPERIKMQVGRFGQCQSVDDSRHCTNSSIHETLAYRSAYDQSTGWFVNRPRKPINFVTSWIDGSAIYGSSQLWSNQIRTFERGKLKSLSDSTVYHSDSFEETDNEHAAIGTRPSMGHYFGTGHANSGHQQPPLVALGDLFRRYHNTKADQFHRANPNWYDEELFQTTRRHVIAVLQNVITAEYVPALIGSPLPDYAGYRPYVDPSISVEFQSAAFRVGHSFIPSGYFVRRRNSTCGSDSFVSVPLCRIDREYLRGLNFTSDELILGLASQRMERSDAAFSDAVQNRLTSGSSFHQPLSQSDLVATNIMRGRDLGLANYGRVRRALGLLPRASFEEINTRLSSSDPDLFRRLKKLYRNDLADLDLYVGGLLEIDERENASRVGETFRAIIGDQFRRLRDGDRFWFENAENGFFTLKEIEHIRTITLRDVILEATAIEADELQPDVFYDIDSSCPQPYQLNASGLDTDGICGRPVYEDYFVGNELWFIISVCVLIAIPLASCLVAFIIARYRTTSTVSGGRGRKRMSLKRMTSTHMVDAFVAEECTDYKTTRKIQITFDLMNLHLRTYSREAKQLRVIDFSTMPVKIMARLSSDVEKNCALVVHIPKEYDLVLSFDTIEIRTAFVDHLRAFLGSGEVKRHVIEIHVRMDAIMDYATTLAQRRKLLESFFHTAFDQVLHAKDPNRKTTTTHQPIAPVGFRAPATSILYRRRFVRTAAPRSLLPQFGGSLRISTQSPSTKAKQKRVLLTTELNKLEFAEPFQLKPDSLFVQQMFAMADKDRNGYISYPEFIDILALMSKGTMESKMRMLFDMYDLDGSNQLDRGELRIMIRSLLEIAGDRLDDEQVDRLVMEMIGQCGFESKQVLTFEDFLTLIQKHQSELTDGFGLTSCEVDLDTGPKKTADDKKQCPEKGPEIESEKGLENRPEKDVSPVIEQPHNETTVVHYWNLWKYYLENNWSSVFISVSFLLFTAGLFFYKASEYYYQKEHTGTRQVTGVGVSTSRGAALAISFSFALLILSVCRNVMTKLRMTWLGRLVPFDDAITFHKLVAYTALFYSIVHVVGHGVNFYEISTQPPVVLRCLFPAVYFAPDFRPRFTFWLYGTIAGMTGILLVICLSIIYVFGVARQHIYAAFYLTHRLFIPVYILTLIHGSSGLLQEPTFYMFVGGPIALYVFDWLISLQTQCISAKIHKAEVLPSDVIHLELKPRTNQAYGFHSGQYVRIACGEISDREYHPFTITTAPHEKLISVHIRAVGPWTRRLLSIFKEAEGARGNGPIKHPKIYIDGPYGSSHQDWYKFEAVVLVGAGIGVTPHASVLKDLIHKVYHARSDITCRQVYFAWVARTHTQFEWFIDILRQVEKEDTMGLAKTDIFVTQLMKDFDLRTMMLYICEHQFQRISNTSLFTGLSAKTHFGRPNFDQYLFGVRQKHLLAHRIGVFTCGPKTIVRTVESACNHLNRLYPEGPRLVAHHEIF